MSVFPELFEKRMREFLRDDWNAFSNSQQSDLPVAIRINTAKSKDRAIGRVPWTLHGFYLQSRPSFTLDPSFHAGAYYVQEASSMFLEQVVTQVSNPAKPLKVLDLCAAPGGKSTHLLSLISRDSLLVSNEVISSRATILSENIQKWGFPNVVVTNNDPKEFRSLNGFFDLIVLDAPCSGEGLFRKDPSAMREWSPDHVNHCAQRQKRILDDVWPALKENGVLVYCTCTYNEQENEDNLIWLSEQHSAQSVDLAIDGTWGIEKVKKQNTIGYRFFPHKVKGEGFFISAVRKTGSEIPARHKSTFSFSNPSRSTREKLSEWIRDEANTRFISHENLILMMPSAILSDVQWLSEKLKVLTKGTALATVKHDKLVPEHASALSIALETEFFNRENLTKDQAIAFLRKESISIGKGKRGFSLVTYEGLPIGWVNLLGNRVNNLYPSAWRIRMGS